jgi:hypothetical protein
MMRSIQIAAGGAVRIPYTFPGYAFVLVQVVSSVPVIVYIVDADGLAAFSAGAPLQNWGSSPQAQRDHNLRVQLPPRAEWNLLIVNQYPEPALVSYDATLQNPLGTPGTSSS